MKIYTGLKIFLYLTASLPSYFCLPDSSTVQCNDLLCRNNSTCKVTQPQDGNQSVFECRCQDGWVGRECEGHIILSVVNTSATSVQLSVGGVETPLSNLLSGTSRRNVSRTSEVKDFIFTYTLHYWMKNQSDTCNIISTQTSKSVTVAGLLPASTYLFCAKSLNNDWCSTPSFGNSSSEHTINCVPVITKQWTGSVSQDQQFEFPFKIVIPVLSILLVGLIAVCVVCVCLKTQVCKCRENFKSKKKERSRNNSSATLEELVLYGTTPPAARILINAPTSPGRPKHKLNKRIHGYASFSAHNEHHLPLRTVLEYTQPSQELEEEEEEEQRETHEEMAFI